MNDLGLDQIDRRILNLLQQDSSISNVVLADQVGLSPPACLRRVNRLREIGVICAEVALLDPKKVGYQLNIIVEVELERDRPDLYDQFRRKVLDAQEVTQCYQVTGEVDFILIVVVPDMQAYEAFIQRVLYTETNMRKFRSLISLHRDKFETAVVV
ncbi:Lrp/AsnC family transcriptional regulator [Spartinivicinus poritis]|uniref:Lrp/AsnC family transcriptional regulator n=1 Tax=Spartinivicinus poritis TaxID=2994640 RepID=A0ABT5UEG2_9GAMM|nr:Lrp/AsnC family transcriptional regulator [Spartinivicinus sp. A2-2]MDE1463902.1 Lrp/AsnC family transcriptional regulator [Spartinivicinus sp. A2-2]